MKLNDSSVFIKLQKRFKQKFNINIAKFAKDQNDKINFKLFEERYLTLKQREVLDDINDNFCSKLIFNGGISSGKTFLASYLLIKFLIQNQHCYHKDTNNFIVGSSIGALLSNTLKQIEKICQFLDVDCVLKVSRSISCTIAGLTLNVYGGKNRDAFSKIRGSNSAWVYVYVLTSRRRQKSLASGPVAWNV
ncbi:terminase family protein [Pseudomonas aeruginosa]|nr:terminase family protein [Pseudomonas aeruginosa]